MNDLKMYMVWFGPDPEEGAGLVFAYSNQEARKIAFHELKEWGCENRSEVHARAIKKCGWLREEMETEAPHYITPRTCSKCGLWGNVGRIIGGLCAKCRGTQ